MLDYGTIIIFQAVMDPSVLDDRYHIGCIQREIPSERLHSSLLGNQCHTTSCRCIQTIPLIMKRLWKSIAILMHNIKKKGELSTVLQMKQSQRDKCTKKEVILQQNKPWQICLGNEDKSCKVERINMCPWKGNTNSV